MKVAINVKDKSEAERVTDAMRDQTTRALMNVVGALMPLTARERHRVLAFIESSFSDDLPARPLGAAVGGDLRLLPGTPDPRD